MKHTLIWSPVALQDMEEIYDFYTIKNEKAAAKIYNGILDEVEILKEHPFVGPIESILQHRKKPYRSLVVSKGHFKVLYFVDNTTVYIAGVWNCKQDTEKIKQKYNSQ